MGVIHDPCVDLERLKQSELCWRERKVPFGAYLPESLDNSQWWGADNTYTYINSCSNSENITTNLPSGVSLDLYPSRLCIKKMEEAEVVEC